MASKADRFYFDNFIEAADYACQGATFLLEFLKSYRPDSIEESLNKMHAIEHSGDLKKHEMSAALAKAFVTPVDREDLALISQNIDEVTDSIEDVFQRFYVDQIQVVLPEAIEFAEKLIDNCQLMKATLEEFAGFKKPAKLREQIIQLNHAEEECDALYLKALRAVPSHCQDVLDILYWREIYDCLEGCADACEDVGDCIEMVVMKNT